MAEYSHTKLGAYEQCPQKYKFRYLDRIKADKTTIEAFLGSRVHKALEKLYADLQLARLDTLDELLAFYRQDWEKNFTPAVDVVRAGLTPEHYFATGRRMLETYYRRYHPFDQDLTLNLELPVSFPLADGTLFRGFVDRVARNGEHVYEIHDYKTSRQLPSQQEIRRDRQLPLYEVALRHRWPDVREVRLVWHYLAFDTDFQAVKTEEELRTLQDGTLALIREIESAREFPTHESPLCDWCEYYDICPAKQHAARVAALPPAAAQADSGIALVDRYVALREQRRGMEDELEELEQALFRYAEANNLTVVVGTDKKVRVQQTETLALPTKKDDPAAHARVIELLRQAGVWEQVSSFDARAAAAALDAGALPEGVARQLAPYLKKEIRKKLTLSRRDRED